MKPATYNPSDLVLPDIRKGWRYRCAVVIAAIGVIVLWVGMLIFLLADKVYGKRLDWPGHLADSK